MNSVSDKPPVKTTRDIEVVQIPEGFKVRLARGTSGRLMQALGDTFTLMTEYGTMVRVSGEDADAIGQTVKSDAAVTADSVAAAGSAGTAAQPLTAEEVKEKVWVALKGVYDPEIPVNVVELGLVYENEVTPIPEGGYKSYVKMTLTAPGCGMGPVMGADADRRIRQIPGVKDVKVDIVVEPAWNQDMMSEAAKLQLGL